jgi:thiamin-phosphate kinase
MSKFSLDVLKKCVFPFVEGGRDPDILLSAVFGEDVALTSVGEEILASHIDPIVGAVKNIGWLAVHVACNDLAASGAAPRWLLLLVLVPQSEDEDLLEEIMRDANRATRELGASIVGGHTGYSSGLSRPLVAVASLGTISSRKPVLTSGAQVGDEVGVTKGVGLEGTGILAHDFEDVALETGLSQEDLKEGRQLMTQVSVVREALALAEEGVTSMHDVTRGGVLESLLEIADRSGVGIEVDYSQLPIPSIVSRFAKAFEFDPLQMISSGTLALTVPPDRVVAVSKTMEELGTRIAFVGHVTAGEGVSVMRDGGVVRYTEICCEEDELARMWVLHPRGR